MNRVLLFIFLFVNCIPLFAEKNKYIFMHDDGTVQTASGTIYKLFQGEKFAVGSTNALVIFPDTALINCISGHYYIHDTNYQFDIESMISVRRDNDSLYVRVKRMDGLRECL